MGRFWSIAALLVLSFVFYGIQPFVYPGAPSASFVVVAAGDAPTLVQFVDAFSEELGDDKEAYLNHCLRTLSFAQEFLRMDGLTEEYIATRRKVMEIALAFHDIALWSDGALNYLEPSAAQAEARVADQLTKEEMQLVRDIIVEHHKFTPFSGGEDDAVVNAVRLADWLDFSQSAGFALRSGMPSGNVAIANALLPSHSFIDVLGEMPKRLSPENTFRGNLEVLKIYKW